MLMDYIREKDIDTHISNLLLIEPSKLALSRGLCHVDVLKDDDELHIKTICKSLEDIQTQDDLASQNNNTTLHLFLNILEIQTFDITKLCHTISQAYGGENYFVLVSPNTIHNDKLDTFYNYFQNSYNTELISKRDKDIGDYTRYEIIFKVEI
jgi:hypothetical protein